MNRVVNPQYRINRTRCFVSIRSVSHYEDQGCRVWAIIGPNWYQTGQISHFFSISFFLHQVAAETKLRFVSFAVNLTQTWSKTDNPDEGIIFVDQKREKKINPALPNWPHTGSILGLFKISGQALSKRPIFSPFRAVFFQPPRQTWVRDSEFTSHWTTLDK